MTTLVEGKLRFTFPDAIGGVQFDDREHGLSHCMKAVDFVIEFEELYVFVEVKDLFIPADFGRTAGPTALTNRENCNADFVQKFLTDRLRPELVRKFRDSFIYRWAEEKLDKKVIYLLLLELPSVTIEDLLSKADELEAAIPVKLDGCPVDRWSQPIAIACKCFTVATWAKQFPKWSIERIA
jgi:hypothetical protein